jgi:hypothetical protein
MSNPFPLKEIQARLDYLKQTPITRTDRLLTMGVDGCKLLFPLYDGIPYSLRVERFLINASQPIEYKLEWEPIIKKNFTPKWITKMGIQIMGTSEIRIEYVY